MQNGWDWLAWSLTTLVAIGGLVLGIRAETRARYRPDFRVVVEDSKSRAINRTGEDATEIHAFFLPSGGGAVFTSPFLAADNEVTFAMPDLPTPDDRITVDWVRPLTGKRYRQVIRNAHDNRSWQQRMREGWRAFHQASRRRRAEGAVHDVTKVRR